MYESATFTLFCRKVNESFKARRTLNTSSARVDCRSLKPEMFCIIATFLYSMRSFLEFLNPKSRPWLIISYVQYILLY